MTDERVSLAGRLALVRRQGGLTFAQLRDRTGAVQLFVDTEVLGRRAPPRVRRPRPRRLGGRRRHRDDDAARRAVRARRTVRAAGQGVARAARQAPRAHRRRDPLPAALRRPGGQRAHPGDLPDPPHRRAGDPRAPRGPRVHRGRGPGAAVDTGRGERTPVRHPPQRPRHRPLPAHRARAAPQAAHRGRDGAGVRDRAGVPQRGHRHPAQPRVHDAGGLPGLRATTTT